MGSRSYRKRQKAARRKGAGASAGTRRGEAPEEITELAVVSRSRQRGNSLLFAPITRDALCWPPCYDVHSYVHHSDQWSKSTRSLRRVVTCRD